jgi:hypothetical protein
MTVKKLAVCGDSFMTSSYHKYNEFKGLSWPQNFFEVDLDQLDDCIKKEAESFGYRHYISFVDFLVEGKGFDYTNLALRGASNFMIRMQIDQAIKSKADYVIIGSTSPDRVDVPVQGHRYGPVLTWPPYKEQLEEDSGRKKAIENYVKYISDDAVDSLKSYYMLQGGLDRLEKLGIPYIFLTGPMKDCDWTGYNTWPTEKKQPWDYLGVSHKEDNHLDVDIQQEMAVTLKNITKNWSN